MVFGKASNLLEHKNNEKLYQHSFTNYKLSFL